MNTKKISNEEIKNMKISSLPSRPTAPTAFGGRGYTASDMKEAFDRLPLFIIERLNSLLDDIARGGEDGIAAEIKTDIKEGHTLRELFLDVLDGSFSGYLALGEETLEEYKERAEALFRDILLSIERIFSVLNEKTIDCGRARDRMEVVA